MGPSTGAIRDGVPSWPLQDAKARFSEVVRRARTEGPQRVTVRGLDAVVVVAAEVYAETVARASAPSSLRALLQDSPLGDLEFGADPVAAPVREIDL